MVARGLRLPALAAPTGATVQSSGSMYSTSQFKTYSVVQTAQSAEQVRDHYVRSLKAQGWTAVQSTTTDGELVARFQFGAGSSEGNATFSLKPRPELKTAGQEGTLNRYDVQLDLTF